MYLISFIYSPAIYPPINISNVNYEFIFLQFYFRTQQNFHREQLLFDPENMVRCNKIKATRSHNQS